MTHAGVRRLRRTWQPTNTEPYPPPPRPLDSRIFVSSAEAGTSDAVAAELRRRGAEIVSSLDRAQWVVLLAGRDMLETLVHVLDVSKRLIATRAAVRGIVTVSAYGAVCAGGAATNSIGSVAIASFMKSAVLELSSVALVNLEVPADAPIDVVADVILAELEPHDLVLDVRYASGVRLLGEWRDEASSQGRSREPLFRGAIVVATGGGRGITAKICRTLALHGASTFEICGRSASLSAEEYGQHRAGDKASYVRAARQKDARKRVGDIEREWKQLKSRLELTENLDALRRAGANVRYASVDTRCDREVRAWLDRVRQANQRIDLILHGAGVLSDSSLEEKSKTTLETVLETKLNALHPLLEAASATGARTVLFSSVAGAFGSPGQADYAAANENLARTALEAEGDSMVVGWGPWRSTGMTAGEVSARLENAGSELLDADDAADALMQELLAGTRGEVLLLAGRAG